MAPGPQYPYSPYPGHRPAVAADGKAATSLVLGLSSIFCCGAMTGIPALVLGFMSRRAIARSGGTLGGGAVAMGGIITGAIGSAMSALSIVFFLVGMVGAGSAARHSSSTYTPTPTSVTSPSVTSYGAINVAELARGTSLQSQLEAQRLEAVGDGRPVIVMTEARWCGPSCAAVLSALRDVRMQRALPRAYLIRLDVDDFASELAELNMSGGEVPTFYQIDATGHATATLSADAWDDNTPANMAPVLSTFLLGGDGGALPDAGRPSIKLPHHAPHVPHKPPVEPEGVDL